MNRFMAIAVIVWTSVFAVSPIFAVEDIWTVDFELAKKTAGESKKDVLMLFTGSDFCPPCIALKRAVFSKEYFQKEAPNHFTLMKVDFPRNRSKQSPEEIQQNEILGVLYMEPMFPTVMLADELGRPYAVMPSYANGPQDPQGYITLLRELKEVRAWRDQAFAEANAASGSAKAKKLDEILTRLGGELPILTTYSDTIAEIVEADENNEAGLKEKYAPIMIEVQMFKINIDHQENPKAAISATDALVAKHEPEGELLQRILYQKYLFQYQDKQWDLLRDTLEQAIDAAPGTELAREIKDETEILP